MKQIDIFSPSGLNGQFHYQNYSFSAYVATMRDVVETTRPDLNEENRERIVDANSPFEWIPQQTPGFPKPQKYKNGILLIHGLFDSPCSMLNIAEYFQKKNYLVRALLLPGHGTVPGDLLNITYHEWEKCTHFGIESFVNQVENCYVCGFSTGGALALHHVLKYAAPHVKGLLLLAPAIQLQRQFAIISTINNVMHRTIGGIRWYTKSEVHDYAKYQSATFASAHQVFLLTKAINALLKKKSLEIPAFIATTTDDEVLSTGATLNFFKSTHHPHNQCMLYTNQTKPEFEAPRIEIRKSTYPELNILNFSHVSIPVAPTHFHYGIQSDYQDFQHYENILGKGYKSQMRVPEKEVYLGAVTRDNIAKYHLQRLTFNPDFHYMMNRIQKFIVDSETAATAKASATTVKIQSS